MAEAAGGQAAAPGAPPRQASSRPRSPSPLATPAGRGQGHPAPPRGSAGSRAGPGSKEPGAGAHWGNPGLGAPGEAEITVGSPRLSPCQLTAGSLLPSSPSHSHVELKSCQALSPAAPTWDSRTHGRAEATNASSSSSIPGAAIASPTAPREDATLSRQGKGQGRSTLSNPSSQRATGFCAPWAGVRLCRRSCGSHVALRARQARMGTGPWPLSGGAAVLPAPAPGHHAEMSGWQHGQDRSPPHCCRGGHQRAARGEGKGPPRALPLPWAAAQAQGWYTPRPGQSCCSRLEWRLGSGD